MTTPVYDVIVLGAGAMGSAAAYDLARDGQRVLLLEQFAIDHPNGSSYGNSRIIRYMYDHPAYVALAKAAYPLWRELEQAADEPLLHITGGIDFGHPEAATFKATLENAAQHAIPIEHLTPDEAMRRFPALTIPQDHAVVYQADYGLLNASACVRAQVRLAQQHGAQVVSGQRVRRVAAHPDSVTVETESATYHAARLVITAGAWTNAVLADLGLRLPLEVRRIQYAFFRPAQRADYQPPRYPVMLLHTGESFIGVPYSIPDYDQHGVKYAYHDGPAVASTDEVQRTPDPDVPDSLRPFFERYIPGVVGAPHVETHVCLYTMTPDTHFVIDRHPEHAHITLASPCSGHGFKFSRLIGQMLSRLAQGQAVGHDLGLFSLGRFGAAVNL
jgi:monomeric sarcosine oxidase